MSHQNGTLRIVLTGTSALGEQGDVDTLVPHWHDDVQDDVDTKIDVCMRADDRVVERRRGIFRKFHVIDLKKKKNEASQVQFALNLN